MRSWHCRTIFTVCVHHSRKRSGIALTHVFKQLQIFLMRVFELIGFIPIFGFDYFWSCRRQLSLTHEKELEVWKKLLRYMGSFTDESMTELSRRYAAGNIYSWQHTIERHNITLQKIIQAINAKIYSFSENRSIRSRTCVYIECCTQKISIS